LQVIAARQNLAIQLNFDAMIFVEGESPIEPYTKIRDSSNARTFSEKWLCSFSEKPSFSRVDLV
jgi:hypothetical protein